MSTFTIGEAAERSGFATSTLRYYEDIGLVVPVGRSDAGYRIYDDRAIERLAFVSQAKRLGCSLDEITDLIGIWDGDDCAPVQRRFHELVTAKLDETEATITALRAFSDQLRVAAAHLAGPSLEGPCDERCACLVDGSSRVALLDRGSKGAR